MSGALLALDRVTCRRGGRTLFAGLNLALHRGDAAIVVGPNGVGKSSLLRLAAGLLAPAAGSVTRAGRITLAAEAAALDEDRPLADALLFWAHLDGSNGDDVARALAAVGMAALGPVPVRMLSTGQRRRATLARVIASGAPIWLLDEPATGLDAASLDALGAAMAGHRAAGGVILAASHQPLDLDGAQDVSL